MVRKTKPNCQIRELLGIRIRTADLNEKQTKLKEHEDWLVFRMGKQKRNK